jgi:hypothetical protein
VNDENPYAAPKSNVRDVVDSACRRDGEFVFVPKGCALPGRCIICNEPAVLPSKSRKMYWHSPWLYVLVFLNIFVYALIALVVRKSTEVAPGYCAVHAGARRRKIYLFAVPSIVLMLAAPVMLFVAPGTLAALVFVAGFVLLIPGMIVSRTIWPKRIDPLGATFAGCKEPFLSSLP